MVTIDQAMLDKHGIKVPAEGAEAFLNELKDQVEKRVGLALMSKLEVSDAKHLLQELENGDAENMLDWISERVPNYEQLVEQETAAALDDIAADQAKQ